MDRWARRALLAAAAAGLASGGTWPGSGASAAGPDPRRQAPSWVSTYSGPASWLDSVTDMAVSSDRSTIYVTGESRGDDRLAPDFATIAYAASTGQELWVARFDGPAHESDYAASVDVSSDGAMVVVTGTSIDPTTWRDFATVAYDAATGNQLWEARYTGFGARHDDVPEAVAIAPDSQTVFVTGSSDRADGADVVTIAYKTATGGRKWIRREPPPDAGTAKPYEMLVGQDGAILYVVGEVSARFPPSDYLVLAYDATTGERKWILRFGRPGKRDLAVRLALSPDQAILYVTGPFGPEIGMLAMDAVTGHRSWLARFRGLYGGSFPDSIQASADGSMLFIGATSTGAGPGLNDYLTLAYDAATGDLQWVVRYADTQNSNDILEDLTLTPDGTQVVVTGTVYHGTEHAILTISYDPASGETLWMARYADSGSDSATAMAVAGSGLVITGTTPGAGRDPADYLTFAYPL